MWSWQDLVFAGIGFRDSQPAGAAAFLVGGTPMWRGKALGLLSFLWLVGFGGGVHF